jgi:amidohydrolase
MDNTNYLNQETLNHDPSNNNNINKVDTCDVDLVQWLIKTRRDFHQHPELGFQEKWTTSHIAQILSGIGIDVQLFDDMTGVVGLLRFSADPEPCFGLRADMDALPIEEKNDTPYKSLNPGCMHACGHDAHITIMLGVAKKLVESCFEKSSKNNLIGSVKFLFQPAEENGPGSQPMIDRGALKNPEVDRIVAYHVTPSIPVGKVEIPRDAVCTPGDSFEIVISGTGGHPARPHLAKDPITAGTTLVSSLQTVVTRDIDPMESAIISVCSFQAGSVGNVIPQKAVLKGTIRALTQEVREFLHKRIRQVATEICSTFKVNPYIKIEKGCPPTINDHKIATFMHQSAVDVIGLNNVGWGKPIAIAEDFSLFAQVTPCAMMWLGTGSKKHSAYLHTPDFDIDEDALSVGVNIMTHAVRQFLKAE